MAEVNNKNNEKQQRRSENNRPRGKRNDRPVDDGLEKRMVNVRSVQKTVKGGRTLSFSALCVVGDRKGRVGIGTGKARETVNAIEKAFNEAKKNMITVNMNGTTIPHEIVMKYGASTIALKPAKEGTGVIAGGAARPVLELAGIRDITAKNHGSNNKINTVRATFEALKALQTAEQVAAIRGKKVEEL